MNEPRSMPEQFTSEEIDTLFTAALLVHGRLRFGGRGSTDAKVLFGMLRTMGVPAEWGHGWISEYQLWQDREEKKHAASTQTDKGAGTDRLHGRRT